MSTETGRSLSNFETVRNRLVPSTLTSYTALPSSVLGPPQPSRLRRPWVDVGFFTTTSPLPVTDTCENT